MDLFYELQTLLPLAIKWAEEHSNHIQKEGIALTPEQIEIAKKVGVSNPEKVRIQEVEALPFPEDKKLNDAAKQTGFLNDGMKAMTLGHSIYICRGFNNTSVLSYELRHVYQYETFRSIPAFLVEYLKQIVLVGYDNALLVQDAKKHQIN